MKIGVVILFIFVGSILLNTGNTYPCFFSCRRQNRTFTSLSDGMTTSFSTGDPSVFTSTKENITLSFECYERSGPFMIIRRLMDGKYMYRCEKDTAFETSNDVVVWYATEWEYFPEPPSICEVCNGTGFGKVHVVKACKVVIPDGTFI
ncbi:uncharacterized protein LOC127711969 [Mytilus californianus]|uniref:uncharacterized protein LOC127711969 n=1 Tax=Mytilus californianus TaxID=6549 RepID=UPI002247BD3A|nr:uncharacterized protein LOC127711969 [Mytilus californianus]